MKSVKIFFLMALITAGFVGFVDKSSAAAGDVIWSKNDAKMTTRIIDQQYDNGSLYSLGADAGFLEKTNPATGIKEWSTGSPSVPVGTGTWNWKSMSVDPLATLVPLAFYVKNNFMYVVYQREFSTSGLYTSGDYGIFIEKRSTADGSVINNSTIKTGEFVPRKASINQNGIYVEGYSLHHVGGADGTSGSNIYSADIKRLTLGGALIWTKNTYSSTLTYLSLDNLVAQWQLLQGQEPTAMNSDSSGAYIGMSFWGSSMKKISSVNGNILWNEAPTWSKILDIATDNNGIYTIRCGGSECIVSKSDPNNGTVIWSNSKNLSPNYFSSNNIYPNASIALDSDAIFVSYAVKDQKKPLLNLCVFNCSPSYGNSVFFEKRSLLDGTTIFSKNISSSAAAFNSIGLPSVDTSNDLFVSSVDASGAYFSSPSLSSWIIQKREKGGLLLPLPPPSPPSHLSPPPPLLLPSPPPPSSNGSSGIGRWREVAP